MKDIKDFLVESYKTTKASDLEDLFNKFMRRYKLNEQELENLFYLVHSDNHIYEGLKKLIAKVQKNGRIPEIHLYRGCSDKEYKSITETGFSNVETLSFSESKEMASEFGNNVVEIVAEVPMFCYHEFLGDYFSSIEVIDPEEFDATDGETMIETAEEELEWICTNDYKFVPYNGIFKLTK